MYHPHQKLSHTLLLLSQQNRPSYALCSRRSARTDEDLTVLAPSDPPPAPSAVEPEGSASLADKLLRFLSNSSHSMILRRTVLKLSNP